MLSGFDSILNLFFSFFFRKHFSIVFNHFQCVTQESILFFQKSTVSFGFSEEFRNNFLHSIDIIVEREKFAEFFVFFVWKSEPFYLFFGGLIFTTRNFEIIISFYWIIFFSGFVFAPSPHRRLFHNDTWTLLFGFYGLFLVWDISGGILFFKKNIFFVSVLFFGVCVTNLENLEIFFQVHSFIGEKTLISSGVFLLLLRQFRFYCLSYAQLTVWPK